jgi:NitT/TauT family transport system ATP-binding protein
LSALTLVGLQQAADKHPHQLSGGMQQRAALARALAVEPSMLLLDEPFAALDAFTRLHLQDELLLIWQKKRPTIIFVTHDLDEAIALGQRIVLLAPNPGRVQRILTVGLPYPRERTASDFAEFRRELFNEFHLIHEQLPLETDFSI